MQGNRSRGTRPELLIRSLLHRRGLRFRVCCRPIVRFPRSADIVFTKAHLAVFVDGCYWHGCPTHFVLPRTNSDYWMAKIGGNRQRDVEFNRILQANGWMVVRVWEHQSPTAASDQIVAALAIARDLLGG